MKGLFGDFNTTDARLGNSVEAKNKHLTSVLNGIASIKLDNFDDSKIDWFGDAYEFLIHNYASDAGKSGGEFFTPQTVSNLIARLALHGQKKVEGGKKFDYCLIFKS